MRWVDCQFLKNADADTDTSVFILLEEVSGSSSGSKVWWLYFGSSGSTVGSNVGDSGFEFFVVTGGDSHPFETYSLQLVTFILSHMLYHSILFPCSVSPLLQIF